MRKAILLFLTLLAFAVFAIAQTSTAPANQGSPTSSNPNATASPNPSAPQSTMPPDTNQSGTTSSTQSGTSASQTGTSSTTDQNNSANSSVNAQSAQSNQSVSTGQSASGGDVPASTEIRAALDTPLSTKTSKVGDTFTATVAEPIRNSSGQVAIPAGSKVHGEVTEAEQGKAVAVLRGKGKLNMHFRDIQLPDGSSVPLSATLVSVNSTKGNTKASTNSEGEVQSGGTGKRAAKDVGIGAGIGTVAGLIFGSALKGLAIGALAGGGYVLATNGKDVELPAQTGVVLRLDHNLSVSANTATR